MHEFEILKPWTEFALIAPEYFFYMRIIFAVEIPLKSVWRTIERERCRFAINKEQSYRLECHIDMYLL